MISMGSHFLSLALMFLAGVSIGYGLRERRARKEIEKIEAKLERLAKQISETL